MIKIHLYNLILRLISYILIFFIFSKNHYSTLYDVSFDSLAFFKSSIRLYICFKHITPLIFYRSKSFNISTESLRSIDRYFYSLSKAFYNPSILWANNSFFSSCLSFFDDNYPILVKTSLYSYTFFYLVYNSYHI